MAVRVLRPADPLPVAAGPVVRVALVNNMPDPALEQTERQFVGLLDAGAGDRTVVVRRYAMAAVPRGERAAAAIAAGYFRPGELWDDRPDAVIVTGSEPLAPALSGEPYWDDLVALLDEAMSRPVGVLLSCLSAHATLLALDGLDRVPLPAKCSGVFDHAVTGGEPLTAGLPGTVPVPHSRHNGIPTDAVVAAGWRPLLSAPVGWGAVAGRRGRAELLLVQGHPEYGPSTLLREWRRDLGRARQAGSADPPPPPAGAVGAADAVGLDALHRDLRGGDWSRLDDLDVEAVAARTAPSWRPAAERLYRNWVDGLGARQPAEPTPGRARG